MWTPVASYSNLEAKPFISVCECYKKPTIMHIFRESSSNGLYHHAPIYVKNGHRKLSVLWTEIWSISGSIILRQATLLY